MRSLQITGSSRGWGGVFRSLIAVEGGDESEDDWLQRGGGQSADHWLRPIKH